MLIFLLIKKNIFLKEASLNRLKKAYIRRQNPATIMLSNGVFKLLFSFPFPSYFTNCVIFPQFMKKSLSVREMFPTNKSKDK